MQDEKEQVQEEQQQEQNDYIKAISDMKADNERLKADNKRLLESLINGGVEQQAEEEQKQKEYIVSEERATEIKKKLASQDRINNLDGFKYALELRQSDIERGKIDPFVSVNNKTPSKAELEAAQKRADIYQEMIEYANGDPAVFTAELQRRAIDTNYIPKKYRVRR